MEIEFIRWLREQVGPHGAVPVGIGDDAAVLSVGSAQLVVTTDMLMEGVDFEDVASNARRVGRKSLAVNISDLAAMAATPLAAFVSLALPQKHGRSIAEELYAGIRPLAEEFSMAIAGGDTNSWDGPLVISITAIGTVGPKGALVRSGARPGDEILVTGKFGGSILGRHFDFVPRVAAAKWLHENFNVHAAIDVSDGLSLDLARMAEASGCGAIVDLGRIPISPDAFKLAETGQDGSTPLDHALSDGEDFELIIAAPPDEARKILAAAAIDVPITSIGRFSDQIGLQQVEPDGTTRPMTPRGYEHRLQ